MRSRFGLNIRSLSVPGAPSATGLTLQLRLQKLLVQTDYEGAAAVQKEMRQARGALQERLQELVANEDYEEAAKVQEQMRVLAMPQAEFAQGDHKDPTIFEFCMEDLYRELFQAGESRERECRLNAL